MGGDQADDPVPRAGRQIVAHADDRLKPRTGDGARGRRATGRIDHPVPVAVDHQGRHVDLA